MLEVNDTGLLLGIDPLYTQEQINLSIHIVTTLEKGCLNIVIWATFYESIKHYLLYILPLHKVMLLLYA